MNSEVAHLCSSGVLNLKATQSKLKTVCEQVHMQSDIRFISGLKAVARVTVSTVNGCNNCWCADWKIIVINSFVLNRCSVIDKKGLYIYMWEQL